MVAWVEDIFLPGDVVVALHFPPTGGDIKPRIETCHAVYLPVHRSTCVAAHLALPLRAGIGVFGRETTDGVVELLVVLRADVEIAEVAVGPRRDVHFLVGPHVGEPRLQVGRGAGVETHGEQRVELHALVGDDVDDGSRRTISGRGIAQHLDALHTAGRHRLDVLLQRLAAEVRRFVVEPDGHVAAAAQGDVPLRVHLHAGRVLQRVGHRACLHAGVVLDMVEHLFAVGAVERTLGGDAYGLQHGAALEDVYHAQCRVGRNVEALPVGVVAHGRDAQQVFARRHRLEAHRAAVVGGAARDKRAVRRPQQYAVSKSHRLAALCVAQRAVDGEALCRRHPAGQGKHSCQKDSFLHCVVSFLYCVAYQ